MVIIAGQPARPSIGKERDITNKQNRRPTPADRQQSPAFAVCGCCGGEIYLGQLYYEMEDRLVCPECLHEYAKSYFISSQRTAMLPQWRA